MVLINVVPILSLILSLATVVLSSPPILNARNMKTIQAPLLLQESPKTQKSQLQHLLQESQENQ
jgi:hypothetical protein